MVAVADTSSEGRKSTDILVKTFIAGGKDIIIVNFDSVGLLGL